MNIEEIKVGETYYVRVKVNGYNLAETAVKVLDCGGWPCYFKLEDLFPITPYTLLNLPTMTEIPETYPKYDPCRKFRKGDVVTTRIRDGRRPSTTLSNGRKITLEEKQLYIVTKDEDLSDVRIYPIICMPEIDDIDFTVDACYLELDTPFEELAPYRAFNNEKLGAWTVLKNELIFAYYPYRANESDNIVHSKEEAKAAAEAECARLNAKESWEKMHEEHRKEQE